MSELSKFLFEGLPVRGMLVRLTDSWRELLQRRGEGGAYPAPVRELLGEMTAAAVLMQANLKFNGALVLQIHGDGPVGLAVAEVQGDLAFRATATLTAPVPPGAQLEALVNVHGRGRCAITLDPRSHAAEGLPGRQPYQGIVPLATGGRGGHGARREPIQRVEQMLEHYMRQSEQLETRLVLAANDELAAGLLIQRLPVQGEANLEGAPGAAAAEDDERFAEAFLRIATLAATLTREELLSLPAERVLHRLFWEETLRVFEPLSPRFACSCSRQRVGGMLRGLGRPEIDSIVAERGEVEIGCEFCGAQYRFDAVDVGELFTPGVDQPPGPSVVQ